MLLFCCNSQSIVHWLLINLYYGCFLFFQHVHHVNIPFIYSLNLHLLSCVTLLLVFELLPHSFSIYFMLRSYKFHKMERGMLCVVPYFIMIMTTWWLLYVHHSAWKTCLRQDLRSLFFGSFEGKKSASLITFLYPIIWKEGSHSVVNFKAGLLAKAKLVTPSKNDLHFIGPSS